MHSDILACERSTYPVLLHCLKCLSHDVRPLQLVNKSMCAAFRHFKEQVDEHTAKREEGRLQSDALLQEALDLVLSAFGRPEMPNPPALFVRFVNPVERPPTHMQQRTASSGSLLLAVPVRAIEPPPVHVIDTNMQIPSMYVDELLETWAQFDRFVNGPEIDLEPRSEQRMVFYSNNILDNSFDDSFVRGFRIFNAAQLATGAAVQTEVVEVD
jgi:hypothetical protein